MNQLDQMPVTERHVEIPSKNLDGLSQEAMKLHRQGMTAEAKRIFRYLLSQSQAYEHCLNFTTVLFEDQDWLECLRLIDLALDNRGSQLKGLHDLYRMQGCCFTQIGNWELAEDAFYSALEHPGPVDTVLVNLGTLDIQRKQWESSTQSFREAVKINAQNDKGWVGLALCHRFKGDHTLALANLEKALDLNPKNETAMGLLLAWYSEQNLGVIFERLRTYVLNDGADPQLWLAFIESAQRTGHIAIANLELERLRLTHPGFLPAYQYKI